MYTHCEAEFGLLYINNIIGALNEMFTTLKEILLFGLIMIYC
jgi:hypothetical protein